MSLDIDAAFANKTFFVTGASGFVGKVLLFRILQEFPQVRRVYLLMRGKYSRRLKRQLSAQERLDTEVLGSPCFEPLRKSVGEEKWKELSSRVLAVEGDITHDRLGLSSEDYARLENEVNYIAHLAATVNFNERLNVAVQMNTLGGLRVLTLAQRCKKLEAMVHTSTCYVNWSRHGREEPVEEMLYPLNFDPEQMCKYILSLRDDNVEAATKQLLAEHKFPNTYTFTKNMGEHLIRKYKENVPIVIVRPAVVGCALRDPMPGWVDALTATGVFVLTSGFGILREMHCDGKNIADIVPVDFVINTIIKALFKTQLFYKTQAAAVAAAAAAPDNATLRNASATGVLQRGPARNPALLLNSVSTSATLNGKKSGSVPVIETAAQPGGGPKAESTTSAASSALTTITTPRSVVVANADALDAEGNGESLPFVYQASTSAALNRTTWDGMRTAGESYWVHRHPKSVSRYDVCLTPSRARYLARFYLLRALPYYVLSAISRLPEPIGSKKKQQLVQRLGRALNRMQDLNSQFNQFVMYEWVFSNENTAYLDEGLSKKDKDRFAADPYDISWTSYYHVYSYGVLKYIVGDTHEFPFPVIPPTPTEQFMRAKL